ncbi:hypothetical protein MHU86_14566 [Fragilaria crotonensis]|nr:hypothetical protein MHU86_14566 [Fragilaria crotonensis]
MKGIKRGTRRPSGTTADTSGESDNAGFNAKTLKNASNYDSAGERKMRLNNKPIFSPTATKPKLPNLSLRASLNRIRTPDPGDQHDLSRNLMDDQSVASFGITDSRKFEVLSDVELARSSNPLSPTEDSHKQLPPRRSSAHAYTVGASTSSASFGDAASQDHVPRRYGGKASSEKLHNSWSESAAGTTTEPIDMFDNFTQQRRSSASNSGEPDPFESVDAFASNSADVSNFKPPAVQRASQIDEEPSIDDSNKSDSVMKDSSAGDHGRIKKSKMQKIGELLAERKKWSLERRILRAKTMSQAEKISRLEQEVKELGESEARAEEMKKLTRDLDKSQKEAKLAKKQLLRKKTELMAKDKELVNNEAEISTLRKELSKALQQVDMLEEELENDKTRILTLTKGLLGADSGRDDYSTDYVETRQEQQEMFERELNKKDQKIESQRLEVNRQAEQILLLKNELAQAQTLGRKNEVLADQIADLVEANEAITAELGLKEQELADARKKQAAQNTVHAAKVRELERERRSSARDLLATSRTIGRDDEAVAALRKDLTATKSALSESQQKIATITSQNVESIVRLQDTIHQIEKEKMELQSKLQQGDPSLQSSINHLQHTNQDLERTVQDLERNLDRERKEFEKLESKLNSQISSLRSSLEASQNLHQQSENEAKMGVSGLQAKLSETEMALEEVKLYNEELEASVEELKETSADVEQEFARLQEEHLELQAKAEKLEQELENAIKSYVEVQARLAEIQEQGVVLDEKNQRLERELAQAADENERLKGNVEDAEAHAAEAQQAVSALEDLMDEYDDLQDEAHTLREKVSTLELELVKVKMDSREWKASADRAEKDISDARESLALAAGAQSELELLKEESNKFFQDFIQVQKKLEVGNIERDALRKQVREASVQLEEYVAIVTELEDEQSRLHGIDDGTRRLRDFKQSAESQINELTCERDKWMESATAAMAGLAGKEAEISNLASANSEYSALRAKETELRAEVEAHRSEIEVIRKERDDFKVAAAIADAELAKARSSLSSLDGLMEDYELLQTEADTLHQNKIQLERELETLLKQKSELEETSRLEASKFEVAFAELEALRSQVQNHERDTSALAHTNADLVVKVAELHSTLDDWKKKAVQAEANSMDATELGERCVEYQKRIEAMESIIKGLHEDYDKAVLKMETLEVENAKWRSSYDMTTSELNETRGASQSLEKQYQEELTTLRAEQSRLLSEIGEKDKRDLVAQSEAGELRILRNQLRAEIDALNAQKAELQSRSVASNIVAVEANAIPGSRSVGGKIDLELKHLQAENERLAARVNEMDEERKQLVEKNMEVQMQLADRDSTRASLDETKRARISLQADLDSLRERYALMDQKIESITSERDHWREMAEASENQAGEANDALIALEEQMEQSRRIEREQMNSDMKALQSQIDDLVFERNHLKESLAKADTSITNAVREAATLRLSLSELNTVKDKIGVLESENADLVAKVVASSKRERR